MQAGFVIADHLLQILPDGVFVFARDGEMETGTVLPVPGVEGSLDQMFLQGGPAPLGIGVEFQERLGKTPVIQSLFRQDIPQDRRIVPFL